MSDAIRALVKGTGDGGVAGEDLARAMPGALAVNIREAVDALEDDNKLMADGPLVGLAGVRVYEIDMNRGGPRAGHGRGGKERARGAESVLEGTEGGDRKTNVANERVRVSVGVGAEARSGGRVRDRARARARVRVRVRVRARVRVRVRSSRRGAVDGCGRHQGANSGHQWAASAALVRCRPRRPRHRCGPRRLPGGRAPRSRDAGAP